jgi:outer membrane protein OmpA-like peptidoglycan-associated protein
MKRARAVKTLLEEEGVDFERLETDSHGEGNPLIETADNVAEPRNRRVEVIVR